MAVLAYLADLGHLGLAGVWFGAMTYSLFVVQPRAARLLGEQRYEEFAAVLANGARWSVLAVCAGLALTGAALAGLAAVDAEPGAAWWSLIVAKIVLLGVALGVFWFVSWRLWPRRIFALPEELPALARTFRFAARSLLVLVASQFVLGGAVQALDEWPG